MIFFRKLNNISKTSCPSCRKVLVGFIFEMSKFHLFGKMWVGISKANCPKKNPLTCLHDGAIVYDPATRSYLVSHLAGAPIQTNSPQSEDQGLTITNDTTPSKTKAIDHQFVWLFFQKLVVQ